MSSNQPPKAFILPAAIAGAIVAPAVSWLLAGYSPDFKNNLTRFGFALPERVTDAGLSMGSGPSVQLGGSALITWLGLVVVIIGVTYVVAALRYEEFDGSLQIDDIDSPPEQPQHSQMAQPGYGMPQQGYPGQMMPGAMPGGMPGGMPGYGMAPMQPQIPPHMNAPMQ